MKATDALQGGTPIFYERVIKFADQLQKEKEWPLVLQVQRKPSKIEDGIIRGIFWEEKTGY